MTTEVWIVCLGVFFGRIVDVSLGTLRTMLTVKEKTLMAAMVGVVEVTIWFFIVRQALMVGGNGVAPGLSYAAGFAIGTLIGGKISKHFIKGNIVLQIVINKNDELVQVIRNAGFGVSVVDVNESDFGGQKYMLFCDIDKSRLEELRYIVTKYDENAFIMVSETKHVFNGFIK
jgi:Uncharacterized protein conserved in bacteria